MAARRWRLAGLLLVATLLGTGCNVLSLPYFLFPASSKYPAGLVKLASDDKKKPTKVVILAYLTSEDGPELLQADRDLSRMLTQHLQEAIRDNQEKVDIVPSRKVEKFKSEHSDWHAMDLHDIGKYFETDYVIFVEIASIDLYQKGSSKLMYHGQSEMKVYVQDMNHPDDDPIEHPYRCEYPTRGPIPVDDTNLENFRHEFLDYAAEHLSWLFSAHTTSEEYSCK